MPPIQPVCSGSLAQEGTGKDGACSGRALTWSLDMAVACTQAQMLGNSPGLSSMGIASVRLSSHFIAALLENARH